MAAAIEFDQLAWMAAWRIGCFFQFDCVMVVERHCTQGDELNADSTTLTNGKEPIDFNEKSMKNDKFIIVVGIGIGNRMKLKMN